MRSEISNSSSRSWLMTSTAEPLRASSISAWRMSRGSTRIDAPGRLVDHQHASACGQISRPTMNFCRLPPDSAAASGSALALAHVHGLDDALPPPRRASRDRSCRAPNEVRRSRGATEAGSRDSFMRGAAPWPSRSSGTKAAPSMRRAVMPSTPTGILAAMRIASAVLLQHFAGDGLEELALAVAGDAGDADDLAGADDESMFRSGTPMQRRPACERQRDRAQPRAALRPSAGACMRPTATSSADHHARQRRRGLLRGSQWPTTLPWRSTVARWHMRFTSSRRCEM